MVFIGGIVRVVIVVVRVEEELGVTQLPGCLQGVCGHCVLIGPRLID